MAFVLLKIGRFCRSMEMEIRAYRGAEPSSKPALHYCQSIIFIRSQNGMYFQWRWTACPFQMQFICCPGLAILTLDRIEW